MYVYVGITAATNKHGRVQSFPYDVLDPTDHQEAVKIIGKKQLKQLKKKQQ